MILGPFDLFVSIAVLVLIEFGLVDDQGAAQDDTEHVKVHRLIKFELANVFEDGPCRHVLEAILKRQIQVLLNLQVHLIRFVPAFNCSHIVVFL